MVKRRAFSMKRGRAPSQKRRKRATSAPRARIAAAAKRGKYGGRKKKVTRKGWQMARKKVAKEARVRRQTKSLKKTVEAIINAHEEKKGVYKYLPVGTASAAVSVSATQDVRQGMFAAYLPGLGAPQTSDPVTWHPSHFCYPMTGYGDTALTREGEELRLQYMDNRHTMRLHFPHVDYPSASRFEHHRDEVWLIELLLHKHSREDFEIGVANNATSALSIMKQWSCRKYGVPLEESLASTPVIAVANSWDATNTTGSVDANWKLPRQAEREWAEGVKDRIQVSAPIARQRVRRFTRRDAPMRTYVRHEPIQLRQQTVDVSPVATYTAQGTEDACTLPQRDRFIKCGFFVPHKGERIVYEAGKTAPRKGFEYAQIWVYRNRILSAASTAASPSVHFHEGRVRLRWHE